MVCHKKGFTKNKILLLISMLMLLGLVWKSFPTFFADGAYYHESLDVETVNMPVETGMEVEQQFTCRGSGLSSIKVFFDECQSKSGFVTVSMEDADGNIIINPIEIDLGVYNTSSLAIPLICNSVLNLDEEYAVKFCFTDIDVESPPSIKIYSSSGFGERMYINDVEVSDKVWIEYNYESYYQIEQAIKSLVIVLIGLIFVIVVSMIEISLEGKVLVIIKETLLIILAIGNALLFDYLNGGLAYFSIGHLLKNVIPIYIGSRVVFGFVRSIPVTELIMGTFSFMASIANYFVCLFRGKPIGPWDIKALSTAVTVANNYEYVVTMEIVFAFILLMCLWQLGFIVKFERAVINKKSIIMEVGVTALCMIIYCVIIYPSINDSIWSPNEVYEQEGVVAGFIGYIKYARYDKPDGYTSEKCDELLADIELKIADVSKPSAKNIIVIMNESFADLNIIGEIPTKESCTPFIDSLTENVIKGNLYVPAYGAGTCNSEFEVLTGVSYINFATGVALYETMITEKKDSLVSVLKDEGYQTLAFHPYYATNWNRDKVYSYLGFDKFISIENMQLEDNDKIGTFTSDECNYRYIIEEYENKSSDKLFVFNVTVQNHGGYDNLENAYDTTVDLSQYGDYPQTENYLSLIKKSDEAYEMLIKYFANVEEPTLICMFGDHQPVIETEFYDYLYGEKWEDLTKEERAKKYVTPVIIWTNYDIEEYNIEKISSNYLSSIILKEANVSMPAYDSFLYEVYQEFPVVTYMGFYSASGEYFLPDSGIEDESEILKQYQWVQYDRMN